MKTPGVVMLDAFDLAKHTCTEAFERERMQAPQNLPVGFLDRARHVHPTRTALSAAAIGVRGQID
jgi:hypothetical protein